MESTELKARIFTTSNFYKHLKIMIANFSDIRKSRKTGNVSKAFNEKIMLAVTQVNGCRYCNYVHTKSAIDAGASEEEISLLLNGELGELDNDESLALMFAQHYADTDGNPDKETYKHFVQHYGEQKAKDILATIKVIMAANIHGIALDALQSRLKGKKMKGSKLSNELGIALGILVLLPVSIVQVGFEKLFKKRTENKFNENKIEMKRAKRMAIPTKEITESELHRIQLKTKNNNEMKTIKNFSIITMLIALLMSVGTSYAQENYSVVKRVDNLNQPTTFYPTKATPVNGAISENVVTSSKRVLNQEKPFLKKGVVKTVGEDNLSAWQMTSDEGGNPQSAPNPLTYFTAGAASDLLTQVERGIQIMGLDVDDVKVETEFFFRWDNIMTDDWSGYTDKVVTNIVVESNEPAEKIKELKEMAVRAWSVGESLENKTGIDAAFIINGDDWDGKAAQPGQIPSPISIDNGRTITNTTDALKLQTIEVKPDLSMDMNNPPKEMRFSEVGIAESAHDVERPYLHRLRAKSLTANYETWELYADDCRGYEGINAAPTSREYFTLGTSFCLMSQLTPNMMYFQKKGVKIDDFGVEHQFNYRESNFMTPTMTGEMIDVVTRILVKSDADEKLANEFAFQSLRCCFAGEGIVQETEMETSIYLNGKLVK